MAGRVFTLLGILILCLYALANTRTLCDNGWIAFEGYCYLFGSLPEHFTEAEHYCQQHGSDLVEIYSKLENDFVKEQMRHRQNTSSWCYWIGTTDELIEGTWQWYSSQTIVNFTDWYSGQPDSYAGEDCALFLINTDFDWHDAPCNYNCMALCKHRGYRYEAIADIVG